MNTNKQPHTANEPAKTAMNTEAATAIPEIRERQEQLQCLERNKPEVAEAKATIYSAGRRGRGRREQQQKGACAATAAATVTRVA